MKIERLIGIVFYLINRRLVTANQLADHFEVSKRTILRDIDTLTLAGIPIYSEHGSKGGYTMNPDFRVNEKIIDLSNTQYILLALKSLKSVYGESKVDETYEKVKHIYDSELDGSLMEIDFSVIKENESVISKVSDLRVAIQKNKTITFEYTNQSSKTRQIRGNVIQVYYKWYAWYAFVHDLDKDKNLMFKVVRMNNIHITDDCIKHKYKPSDLLKTYNKTNEVQKTQVVIEYSIEEDMLVSEYFKGQVISKDNSMIQRRVSLQENDFIMFSLILGFGDKLKVISPAQYREKVAKHLQTALSKNYSSL